MYNNKRKVLQVFGSLNIGGAESRMMDVFRHLDRERVSFDFLVFKLDHQPYEDEIQSLGGKVYKCQSPSIKNLQKLLFQVRKILSNENYDAVHAHTSYFSGFIMYAAKLENVPIRIVHARTTGSVRSGVFNNMLISLGKYLISRYTTERIAISENAGRYLFGKYSFEVLPNAIDTEKYQQRSDSLIHTYRKKYNIDDCSFVIGQIGRFNPMKNHLFTLKLFSEYCKGHSDAILVLVGDGNLREEIEKKASELGIINNIRFTGIVRNVHEIIHIFDVMLFPSLYEGLGGVVIEAQAAGVPTIMSDTLPTETDFELGLIRRCSLSDDLNTWINNIDYFRQNEDTSFDTINEAFNRKRYSIEYELKRLYSIYDGTC